MESWLTSVLLLTAIYLLFGLMLSMLTVSIEETDFRQIATIMAGWGPILILTLWARLTGFARKPP